MITPQIGYMRENEIRCFWFHLKKFSNALFFASLSLLLRTQRAVYCIYEAMNMFFNFTNIINLIGRITPE